jgi:hypothetical protein
MNFAMRLNDRIDEIYTIPRERTNGSSEKYFIFLTRAGTVALQGTVCCVPVFSQGRGTTRFCGQNAPYRDLARMVAIIQWTWR